MKDMLAAIRQAYPAMQALVDAAPKWTPPAWHKSYSGRVVIPPKPAALPPPSTGLSSEVVLKCPTKPEATRSIMFASRAEAKRFLARHNLTARVKTRDPKTGIITYTVNNAPTHLLWLA